MCIKMIYIYFLCFIFAVYGREIREKRQLSAVCSDGTRAVSGCLAGGTCGLGYRCDTARNFCCQPGTVTNVMPNCPDGNPAAAGCLQGQCGTGYTCQGNNLCCRSTFAATCTNNVASSGACVGGLCPTNYICQNNINLCCLSSGGTCPAGTTDSGTSCAAAGTVCPTGTTCQNTRCCRTSTGTTTCPAGTTDTGLSCATTAPVCPGSSTCQNNRCCTIGIAGNPWLTLDQNGKVVAAPVPTATTSDKPNLPGKEYLYEQVASGVYRFSNEDTNAMFIVTSTGVVLVDAPLGRADMILAAIREVTPLPVTQLIYGHFHRDHMGDAGKFTTAEKIGHIETAQTLQTLQDPNIPVPTRTFTDTLTLSIGGKTIQLDYKGAIHAPGNIIVWLPNERVIYLVDAINPGWAPFIRLGVATDVMDYLKSMGILLSYPFQTLIPGHNRLGTRQDVETMRQYLIDLQTNAIQANRNVNYGNVMSTVADPANGALQTTLYQNARILECARLTISKWVGVMGGVDVYTPSNCDVVLFAQQFDYGDRIFS